MLQIQKATKKKSKLRLAIEGASGSGKTYSALVLAQSLGAKIAVVDTEHGSASLYADKFNFDVIELRPPYTPENYIEAIRLIETNGYDVCVVDSITHEWNGEGGCLDIVSKITSDSTSKNSYTAWNKVTPRHDKFINTILQSPLHIISTMRSKASYDATKNDKGKLVYEKKGTAPIQRDSIEYEFTIVFDLNQNHLASVSKDRTSLFDGQDFIIDKNVGEKLLAWLNSGAEAISTNATINQTADTTPEWHIVTPKIQSNTLERKPIEPIATMPPQGVKDSLYSKIHDGLMLIAGGDVQNALEELAKLSEFTTGDGTKVWCKSFGQLKKSIDEGKKWGGSIYGKLKPLLEAHKSMDNDAQEEIPF